jgi:hypothetical protein
MKNEVGHSRKAFLSVFNLHDTPGVPVKAIDDELDYMI